MKHPIKILIVDDSKTEIQILKYIFENEPDLQVIACASNGKEAVELNDQLKPDLITMDIQMPIIDGYAATKLIMAQAPTPIIVISTKANDAAMNMTFRALAAGALSVLEKPVNVTSPSFERERKHILEIVRSMAEIKVIKRRFKTTPVEQKQSLPPVIQYKTGHYEIVAIGTSVGGPQALKTILASLPSDFPLPIVIVQHMAPGFTSGFAKWLNDYSALTVKIADNQELLLKGTVYIAPDNYHLEVGKAREKLIAKLTQAPPVSGFRPSATMLLRSVTNCCGKNAIGILLTGMGDDGAKGLLELKNAEGHTLIQDPQSAIVFGMAGVAQSLNAVDKVIDLEKIAAYLSAVAK